MKTLVPFYQHDLGRAELDAIAEVLSGPILTTGDTVHRFEQSFASYLGRRHVLGVTSCTGALHMAMLALAIGPGDEVITTPMTFIATATAILEAGATPIFIDVEPDTGNLDATLIESAITPQTKAILPVHLYGQMCDMQLIRQIADQHDLRIIEDCAHCVEGERAGIRPGQLSDAACFSFYATKNLTCGEGGAIATDRSELIEPLRLLRLHGMTKSASDRLKEGYQHWDMVTMGWKYNMDNIQAAMLLPQMDRIETKQKRRHELAELYDQQLASLPGVTTFKPTASTVHARHLYPILVKPGIRDHLVEELTRCGIGVMVNYRAIHRLSFFVQKFALSSGMFPVAEQFGDRVLSLPFYPTMLAEDVCKVTETIGKILRAC